MKIFKNSIPILTSGFGNRTYTINGKVVSDYHIGIDVVANTSDKFDYIVAPYNCSVSWRGYDNSYGNNIVIYLGKVNGHNYEMRYAHLKNGSIPGKIRTGAEDIKQGEILGYMGATGNVSGGHTHIEVIIDGKPVNPYDYIFGDKMDKLFNKITLPKPVSKNDKVEQVEVLYNDTLRARTSHAINNNNVIGMATKGYYNILSTYIDKTYTWFEVEKGKWLASVEGVLHYHKIVKEEVKEETKEEIKENTENTQKEPVIEEIEENKGNNQEIEENGSEVEKNEKQSVFEWLISLICKFIEFLRKN